MDENNKRKVDENSSKETDDSDSKKMKLTASKKSSKIQLKLSATISKPEIIKEETERKMPDVNVIQKKKIEDKKVLHVFGDDSDDEDNAEKMPLEAKMKMRNIGRQTPTASGPNSYGKTGGLGFCDHRKLFEKQLKEKADELSKQS